MEGISKADLISEIKLANDLGTDLYAASIAKLIRLCKELPGQQWQTIEEFKENTVDGWCWIDYDGAIDIAYHFGWKFYVNDTNLSEDNEWNVDFICNVIPIKTPEAPK